jgi:hypothetical protein
MRPVGSYRRVIFTLTLATFQRRDAGLAGGGKMIWDLIHKVTVVVVGLALLVGFSPGVHDLGGPGRGNVNTLNLRHLDASLAAEVGAVELAPGVSLEPGMGPATLTARTQGWQPQQMSLIVQTSAVGRRGAAALAQLVEIMEDIRLHHRVSGMRGYIANLVIQDIADKRQPGVLLENELSAILPYFPSGPKEAFDEVFVGTVIEPDCLESPEPAVKTSCQGREATWTPYQEGITDPNVRWAHLQASANIARAFVAFAPNASFHWYITWEAFLPQIMREVNYTAQGLVADRIRPAAVRDGYFAYLTQLVRDLSAIRTDRAFMWSPLIDQPWQQLVVDNQTTQFKSNTTSFFSALKSSATGYTSYAAQGLIWMAYQDGLSRPCYLTGGAEANTVQSRIQWHQQLSSAFAFADLSVNAEIFEDSGCPGHGTSDAVLDRLYSYEQAGTPIGASFDLLSWGGIFKNQPQLHLRPSDVVAVNPDGGLYNLYKYEATGGPGLLNGSAIGSGWSGLVNGFITDWNADGFQDLVAQWSNGDLRLYRGSTEPFGYYDVIGHGWNGYQLTIGRWKDADPYPSIVAYNPSGTLYLYANSHGAAIGSQTVAGQGWTGLDIMQLDFDKDGHTDVVAKNGAGQLKLYRSNGGGAFINESRPTIGVGWDVMTAIVPTFGFAGGGTTGMLARTSAGDLKYYPILANKTWGTPIAVGRGWGSLSIFHTAAP